MKDNNVKVPVGVTSIAGYTLTSGAAIAAILAFIEGDRSEQTLGVVAAVALAAISFLATTVGRYAQARILAQGAVARARLGSVSGQTITPVQTTVTPTPSAPAPSASTTTWFREPEPGEPVRTLPSVFTPSEHERQAVATTPEPELSSRDARAVAWDEAEPDDGIDPGLETEAIRSGRLIVDVDVLASLPEDEGDQRAHDNPEVKSA